MQKAANNYESMGMFQGVAFMNMTFGKNTLDQDDPNFWTKLESQAKLVTEELKETIDAIGVKDKVELRDGISDILVTALGLAHLAGFDADDDMKQVLISNMSKVCPTLEDAQLTSRHYWDLNVKTKIEPCRTIAGGYIVKVDGNQTCDEGKFYPDNKFLKSVGSFRKPVFFWPQEEAEAALAN